VTKASPELKPMQGVHRSNGSVNWHYQKKFPKDLQGHPEAPHNGWAYRGTLGTSDLREANGKAAQLLAGLETQWGLMRRTLTITPPEAVTTDLRAAIAHQLKARMLAADEAQRSDPVALALSLAGWWEAQERGRKVAHEANEDSPYRPRQMPRLLTESGRHEVEMLVSVGRGEVALSELLPMLHERQEAAHKEARQRLALKQSGPFLLLADAAARSLGVNLGADGWTSREAAELRSACQRAYLDALEALAARGQGELVETPPPLQEAPKAPAVLTLGHVLGEVVARHPDNGFKRKVQAAAWLMLQWIDPQMPAAGLLQKHVSDFLDSISRLPVDWFARTERGDSVRQLLAEEHPKCISESTFKSTYRVAVGTLLRRAAHEFGDQGFPRGLGTEFAVYRGERGEDEEKQRNFKADELRKMFEGAEFAALAADPEAEHQYWLPLVLLYTGARARELCQINPQVDLGEFDGVSFLTIAETAPADDGVKKKVKTGEARQVPVHPELIRLGFLDYLARMKGAGARRLFPAFGINKGDAGYRAKDWMRAWLDQLGLRDETAGAMLTGCHAFRKTFCTEGGHRKLPFEGLTGHADPTRSAVVRKSYLMEPARVPEKLEVLRCITFAVSPPFHCLHVAAP
jgi:integrase